MQSAPKDSRVVPLSTGVGEVMAPQTLLTALILTPEGTITIEPGALHGRSGIGSAIQLTKQRDQLLNAETYWLVWVAVELDPSNQPVRYTGASVSELFVDQVNKIGYKVLAEHVNRMAEALRGGVNLKTLDGRSRALIREQLAALSPEVWQRSAPAFREALA